MNTNHTSSTDKFYVLELIRSLAAIYVLIYHVQQKLNVGQAFSFLFSFGQEAVMVFFVLSGFVIYYSVENKKTTPTIRAYLRARIIRIYPVFILACLIAYVCHSIISGEILKLPILSFIENIGMLQDFETGKPGTLFQPFMGNTPLWSLSYEWWFYILFIPLYFYISKTKQFIIVILSSSIALLIYLIIPNQVSLWVSYFILWWLGVEAAKVYLLKKSVTNIFYVIVVAFAQLMGLIIYTYYYKNTNTLSFGLFPILLIRHYSMAILFALFLWKINIQKLVVSPSNILIRIAPYTYSLYVFHYPLLQLFVEKKWLQTIWGIPLLLFIIFALCYLAENIIQKYIVKQSFSFSNNNNNNKAD